MLLEITREELSAVLDLVAAETLAIAGVFQPPVDCLRVAQCLGLALAWDDQQIGRARQVKLALAKTSAAPSILLKHDPRQERIQWAVAHEIGESLAPRIFDQLGINVREAPAPAREQGWDLLELKQRYETASHELIARRMLDFPMPIIISVYDHDRLTWRKSNSVGRLPPRCQQEMDCRLRT